MPEEDPWYCQPCLKAGAAAGQALLGLGQTAHQQAEAEPAKPKYGKRGRPPLCTVTAASASQAQPPAKKLKWGSRGYAKAKEDVDERACVGSSNRASLKGRAGAASTAAATGEGAVSVAAAAAAAVAAAAAGLAGIPRGRGRPPGSAKRSVAAAATAGAPSGPPGLLLPSALRKQHVDGAAAVAAAGYAFPAFPADPRHLQQMQLELEGPFEVYGLGAALDIIDALGRHEQRQQEEEGRGGTSALNADGNVDAEPDAEGALPEEDTDGRHEGQQSPLPRRHGSGAGGRGAAGACWDERELHVLEQLRVWAPRQDLEVALAALRAKKMQLLQGCVSVGVWMC